MVGDGILDCHAFPQGPFQYFAEPRGSRRLEARNEVDLRGEWFHDLKGRGRLSFIVDAFNLTNQVRATRVEARDGANLGEPLELSTPRNFRLAGRFTW